MRKILILLIIGMIFIMGCEEVQEDKNWIKCEPGTENVKVCTAEYETVCGENGETYTNNCRACSAGVEKYTMGEC